jgi:archaellum component FlaC
LDKISQNLEDLKEKYGRITEDVKYLKEDVQDLRGNYEKMS